MMEPTQQFIYFTTYLDNIDVGYDRLEFYRLGYCRQGIWSS